MLEIGTKAPDFTLPDQNGVAQSLDDYRGTWTVLYFYPKDDTPGCTKEACMIRDLYDEFAANDIVVIGVSKDSPASHQKFAEKYELPFTLLSDESTDMIQAYGAWQEKSMYGKTHWGIQRMSYVLDPENHVARVYPKVTPTEHAHELVKDIRALQAT